MSSAKTSETGARRHGGRYIYEELRKQILTLKLKPGVQLDEISLAAQFGLSRSPVRDALARLITEGLVTILPNRTTLVTPFEIEEFPNYISALDLIQRTVTRLAATARTEEDLVRIDKTNNDYIQAVKGGDYQAMSECNKALHMQIARAGHNPYFITYYERLLSEGQRLLHLHFDYMFSHLTDGESFSNADDFKTGRDHNKIIKAIIARDADAAEAAAHEHTELFQKRFLSYMQQNFSAQINLS